MAQHHHQPKHEHRIDTESVALLENEEDEHVHYSQRSPWLRAFVLGALDGLVSVASIMVGVGGGNQDLSAMRLAGCAGWIAGSLSMAVGEYISVASQKDSEEADIEKEREEQRKGPESQQRELEELAQIYVNRGLTKELARQVAEQMSAIDVIKAHARDELGIDIDELSNPTQAALVSCFAFTLGALFPLLAGSFLDDYQSRIICVIVVSLIGMVLFGLISSALGGARVMRGAMRVLVGGVLAMSLTYGVGYAFGAAGI
eukprot:gene7289-405_t